MAIVTEPVRVLIVDDDALVRSALTLMLDGAQLPDGAQRISVVGEAADGAEVEGALDAHHPHVVLMDIRMPRVDGIAATQRLRRRADPPEVIVLTTYDTDENVLRALRAGASGFLLKDTPPAQIVQAIQRVASGDPILSPTVMRRMMDKVATEGGAHERAQALLAKLTPREYDVLLGIAAGHPNATIATELLMSVATVKAHISRIMTKLDLNNRTQIALLAHDAGLS